MARLLHCGKRRNIASTRQFALIWIKAHGARSMSSPGTLTSDGRWGFKASWPGLVQTTHVVRRIQRAQATGKGEKPCVCRPLQLIAPTPDSSLRRRGVDGRDKPGHDESGSNAQSAKTGPTANAISATLAFDKSQTTIFEVERSIKMCLSSASSIEALEPSRGGRRAGYSASQRTVAGHNDR